MRHPSILCGTPERFNFKFSPHSEYKPPRLIIAPSPCVVQTLAMTAGRGWRPPSLIDKAILLVKGFDPKKQTVDSYADEATQTGESHGDAIFLKQVRPLS